MSAHNSALYSVEQVRGLDRRAIDTFHISGFELMRRAAAASLACLQRHWPQAQRIVVCCGPGNNGGDGYLLASLAHAAGLAVQVIELRARASGDAAKARDSWLQCGQGVSSWDDRLPPADVYVDALYGIGLNRAPEGVVKAWIEALNASGQPILALDTPSGADADRGSCPGVAVRASVTLSFIAAKRGLATGSAATHAGLLELDRLQLPDSVFDEVQPDAHWLPALHLPPRPSDTHKGDCGHVLAVGGDHGTAGAIRLCSEAALRAGAGLVSLATRGDNLTAIVSARPELMPHAVDGPQSLQPLLDRADVLAIGPGLGQGAWGHALWLTALDSAKPTVLDADGLNLLAKEPRRFHSPIVLTPHPGEAGRLLGMSTAHVQADRYASARKLAQTFNAVIVLKGNGSLIAEPDGRVEVCRWGNPGMATGGMGDLLTGIIAALLGQGCSAWEAARIGVGLHARAGDIAAKAGERGLLATDLLAPLRALGNGREHE